MAPNTRALLVLCAAEGAQHCPTPVCPRPRPSCHRVLRVFRLPTNAFPAHTPPRPKCFVQREQGTERGGGQCGSCSRLISWACGVLQRHQAPARPIHRAGHVCSSYTTAHAALARLCGRGQRNVVLDPLKHFICRALLHSRKKSTHAAAQTCIISYSESLWLTMLNFTPSLWGCKSLCTMIVKQHAVVWPAPTLCSFTFAALAAMCLRSSDTSCR